MDRLIVIMLAALIAGCSVAIKTPSSRFILPEAEGDLGEASASISYSGLTRFDAPGNTDSGADLSGQGPDEFYHSKGLGLHGDMGLMEDLDIYAVKPDRSPLQIGFKYQIIGKNRDEAKKGNHSLAITAAYGEDSVDQSSSDFLISGDSVKTTSRVRDGSLIYGYRFKDRSLVYMGVSYSNYDFDGQYTTTSGDRFNFDAHVRGAHVGVYSTSKKGWGFFKFEVSAQDAEWNNTPQHTFMYVGLQVGMHM
jgi:hypothetical protein